MPASSVFFTFVISAHDPFYGKTRIIRVRYPGPRICRTFAQNCAAVSSQGLSEIAGPLGAAQKPAAPPGSFARRSAKADRAARISSRRSAKVDCAAGLLHGEARKPTCPLDFSTAKRESRLCRRTSSRRSAKADNAAGLCPGEVQKPTAAVVFPRARLLAARPAPAAAKTLRFLIGRGKGSFYETATFRRRKVSFCSPFCGLLFCPRRAKLALPAGEKPAAPNPGRPRGGPPQRPRPAPGFRAASATARPGDPAPVRLLEKALWAPPTTEPFRKAPSEKPERERKRKGGSPMPRPPPVCPLELRPMRLGGLPAETRLASRKARNLSTGGL